MSLEGDGACCVVIPAVNTCNHNVVELPTNCLLENWEAEVSAFGE